MSQPGGGAHLNQETQLQVVIAGKTKWIPTNEDPILNALGEMFGLTRKVPSSRPIVAKENSLMDSEVLEVINARFDAVDTALGTLLAKSAAAPAPSSGGGGGGKGWGKKKQLTDVVTQDLKVKAVFDDKLKGSGTPKWNILFEDGAGLTKRIGTFDQSEGNIAKQAKANGQPARVTWGMNDAGFPDMVKIELVP